MEKSIFISSRNSLKKDSHRWYIVRFPCGEHANSVLENWNICGSKVEAEHIYESMFESLFRTKLQMGRSRTCSTVERIIHTHAHTHIVLNAYKKTWNKCIFDNEING